MNIEVLNKVVKGLNNIDCTWAIGGSVMLSYYGIVKEPKDIDILIDVKDAKKIKELMDSMGTRITLSSRGNYRTEEFFRYIIDGTEIEFLGDFKIELEDNTIYKFIFDEDAIVNGLVEDKLEVNFTTLEDWYVAYAVMGDPKGRIPLIEEYFFKNGVDHENLLHRNLKQALPGIIKVKIKALMS